MSKTRWIVELELLADEPEAEELSEDPEEELSEEPPGAAFASSE